MARAATAILTGWGRFPRLPGRVVASEDLGAITGAARLTRGLGRSYGDASLPAAATDRIAQSPLADRILRFDAGSGRMRAEAGLSLRELNPVALRRGWFPPVTPGTQFVTLGGMVAADVHGKNHHAAGTFGRHLTRLRLRVADGRVIWCSPEEEDELFWATVGGMGLTGHILEVEFDLERIPSPWIWSETERCPDLDALIRVLRAASVDWPFTVAWLDTLASGASMGRGIVIRGRWATPSEAEGRDAPAASRGVGVPFDAPGFVLSRLTIGLFNALYYRQPVHPDGHLVAPGPFFYPLDRIEQSNRLYGRRGFTQYQCVVPRADGHGPVRRVLELARELGIASFLTVLKDFGEEGEGLLSFPKPGLTLTLDFPVRDRTSGDVARLNDLVSELDGRVYLAKDAFTRPDAFRRMEPRLERWEEVRGRWDPESRLRSALSARLLGDAA